MNADDARLIRKTHDDEPEKWPHLDSLTRDAQTAREIGKAQELIGQLQRSLRDYVSDARANDAIGHSNLYAEVESELGTAWKALGDAYDVMSNGDPDDFVF